MAKSGTFIRDVHLLEELNSEMMSSSEAMSNIDANVCNYINGVRDELCRKLGFIQTKLAEARNVLSSAETNLSMCYASQSTAAGMGMVGPSCMMEESEVQAAKMEVEKWSLRYEQGQQIVGECEREIGEYNGSAGGHALICTLCEQQTPHASQFLNTCIDRLHDILASDMGNSASMNDGAGAKKQMQPLSGNGQSNSSNKKIQDVIEAPTANGNIGNKRSKFCPDCGRPIPLCTCKNEHA